MGTIPGSHFNKYCSNRRCSFTQYYGYYTQGLREDSAAPSEAHFNDDWESNAYFVSSRETAFSMKLIHRFHSQILHGQQSFKQCADVYNHLHNVLHLSSSATSMYVVLCCLCSLGTNYLSLCRLQQRQYLDRRQVERAFFQYAALKVCLWYPTHFPIHRCTLHSGTDSTLRDLTPAYNDVFMDKYASEL